MEVHRVEVQTNEEGLSSAESADLFQWVLPFAFEFDFALVAYCQCLDLDLDLVLLLVRLVLLKMSLPSEVPSFVVRPFLQEHS